MAKLIWANNHYDMGVNDFVFITKNDKFGYQTGPKPGKKNLSREPVLHGWIGSTNNVNHSAEGVGRIVRTAWNGRAQVLRLTGENEAAALVKMGHPEMAQ